MSQRRSQLQSVDDSTKGSGASNARRVPEDPEPMEIRKLRWLLDMHERRIRAAVIVVPAATDRFNTKRWEVGLREEVNGYCTLLGMHTVLTSSPWPRGWANVISTFATFDAGDIKIYMGRVRLLNSSNMPHAEPPHDGEKWWEWSRQVIYQGNTEPPSTHWWWCPESHESVGLMVPWRTLDIMKDRMRDLSTTLDTLANAVADTHTWFETVEEADENV